jgi:hypothetical protein
MTANTTENTTGAGATAAQLNDRGEALAVWVIAANSAVNPFRWCILGMGETEAAAWAESGYSKRKRGVRAEHISWEQYDRIQASA